jgi:hypothetical protein
MFTIVGLMVAILTWAAIIGLVAFGVLLVTRAVG